MKIKPHLEFNWPKRTITLWYPTGATFFKVNRDWDGRWTDNGIALSWFGYSNKTEIYENGVDEHTKEIRYIRKIQLWMPYLFFYKADNMKMKRQTSLARPRSL